MSKLFKFKKKTVSKVKANNVNPIIPIMYPQVD